MGDRYTTAGFIVAGASCTVAAALLTVALLNREEPWVDELALAVAIGAMVAVAVIAGLGLASVISERRRL